MRRQSGRAAGVHKALIFVHRPFREEDRGYRDALIWLAVLHDVASTEYHTYFVSENKKDFGDNAGALHADLIANLNEAGLEGCVTYLHDLQAFVAQVIKPALKKVATPVTAEEFEELFEAHLDSVIGQLRVEIDKQAVFTVPPIFVLGSSNSELIRVG